MLPPKFSLNAQTLRGLIIQFSRVLIVAAVMSGLVAVPSVRAQSPGQTVVFPIAIEWTRQSGVNGYRLQISADQVFRDVYYDRLVMGNRYLLNDLPPGYYFWRVAPAEGKLGAFSRPVGIFVSGGMVIRVYVDHRREARADRRFPTHDVGR